MRLALAATVALLTVPALAQDPIVYTGCLKSSDGTLYSVREGSTPMSPCKAKDQQISWSPPPPQQLRIEVNCAEGESINAALAQRAERLEIHVSGTCVEAVVISRDDVTLKGEGTNSTIVAPSGAQAALLVTTATRVILEDLGLMGGTNALRVLGGGVVSGGGLRITGASSTGISVSGDVSLGDATIENNYDGAAAGDGGVLSLWFCSVVDNTRHGVISASGGHTVLGMSTVARNGEVGVYLHHGNGWIASWSAPPSEIRDNSAGVVVEGGHLATDGVRVTGNGFGVTAAWGAVARLRNVTIEANHQSSVSAYGGAVLQLDDGVVIHGGSGPGISLWDSSLAGGSGTITGTNDGIWCAPPPALAQLMWPVPGVSTNCKISAP